jgi:aerobic carbon-monoxide dehydrogenase large subunit
MMKPSRREDYRLVTGTGRFTADWNFPGQLHAVMVRSDHAHARILHADWRAVRAHPGVVAVLTAQDVVEQGFSDLPTGAALKFADGTPMRAVPMPVLAADRVHFAGQPIAMVIAQTAQMAQDAAEQALIEWEDLPVVVGMHAALEAGVPLLHPDAPGNLALVFEDGDPAAVQAAFAEAAYTTTLTVRSQRLIGAPLELRSVVASHDAARHLTRVYTPTQGLNGMRASLAQVSGFAPETIEVIACDVGGSFGLRGGASSEHVLAMLAARRFGRPVKWVASRSELFTSEWHGRALELEGSIALDRQGRILAIRFSDTVDLGAYACYWGAMIGTRNISVTMGGVYAVAALSMRSQLAYTNTTPVSAYRGAGRPDIAYAIERLIDEAAAQHGLDRIALRARNFIAPSAFPYRTANATTYDCGEFETVMQKALALADHAGFAARRDRARQQGRLRGLGLACYLEASGAGAAPKDEVQAVFDAEGSLTIYGMTGASGQGHETSFVQIAAEILGCDPAQIRYRGSDPGFTMVGNGTGGSRSLYGAGSAITELAHTLIERSRPHAARLLEVEPARLRYARGRWQTDDERSITLPALARSLSDVQPHPLNCRAETASGATFPNGCHVAEVEIDPDTGEIEVIRYSAVDDLGRVISPALAAGQVHGGVMQGLGQALAEEAVYDPSSGQLLTGSFMDYPMPRAGWLGELSWESHPVPTRLNALGAKGAGESGCSGSLPALANAVMDALRPLGVGALDMPFTPARIWAAIADAQGKGGSNV